MENSAKPRQKRICNFSTVEKRALIGAVKSKPCIWNISDAMHSNKNAVDQAWDHIGGMIGKSVKECKAAWVSLRESYRYRAKVAHKFRSGSAGGEQLSEPFFSEDIDWEFAEEMSFLPNVSQKRRTFTTVNEDCLEQQEEEATTSKGSSSQYDYTPPTTKRSRLTITSQTQGIWEKFDDLLEKQQEALKLKESEEESAFKQAFCGFEFLLKQLPKNVADQACCSFMQTLLVKVSQQNSIL